MEKRRRKGKEIKTIKTNNQGLTLLELLIAVIVLAIIVVPFLNSFVISANTNSRAAKTHRATSVAQNLVEGFKAGSLSNVLWQMSYPELGFHVISPDSLKGDAASSVSELTKVTGTGGVQYIKSLSSEEIMALNPGVSGKKLRDKFTGTDYDGSGGNARRSCIFSLDGGTAYEFIPHNDEGRSTTPPEEGKYYFSVKGIQMQGSTFDALICLDSTKYGQDSTLAAEKQYNKLKTVELMGMDDTRDAIFVQPVAMDETVIGDLKWNYSLYADEFKTENIRRKITVTIEASGDAKPIHEVKVNYLYTFLPEPTITYGETKDYRIFNNSETGEELRSIYLYYYPWYNPSEEDTIEIDNGVDSSGNVVGGGSLPVELYVVKQEGVAPGELLEKENNYKVSLLINDKQTDTDPKKAAPAVHKSLRTNLEQNLYQAYVPEGSTLPPPQVNYELNNSSIPIPPPDPDKKNPLHWKPDLSGSAAQDRLYELTVEVYEEGAADNNFPEADKLAELAAERND